MNTIVIAVAAACVPAAFFVISALITDSKDRRLARTSVQKAEISAQKYLAVEEYKRILIGAFKAVKNACPIMRGATTDEGRVLLQLSACIQRLREGGDVPKKAAIHCLSQLSGMEGYIEKIKKAGT